MASSCNNENESARSVLFAGLSTWDAGCSTGNSVLHVTSTTGSRTPVLTGPGPRANSQLESASLSTRAGGCGGPPYLSTTSSFTDPAEVQATSTVDYDRTNHGVSSAETIPARNFPRRRPLGGRKGPLTNEGRHGANMMRSMGVCLRCRVRKEKVRRQNRSPQAQKRNADDQQCDTNRPCSRCLSIKAPFWRLICGPGLTVISSALIPGMSPPQRPLTC